MFVSFLFVCSLVCSLTRLLHAYRIVQRKCAWLIPHSDCLQMNQLLIPDLEHGYNNPPICVRVSRFWEYRDQNDEETLHNLSLVLVDEKVLLPNPWYIHYDYINILCLHDIIIETGRKHCSVHLSSIEWIVWTCYHWGQGVLPYLLLGEAIQQELQASEQQDIN